MTLTDADRIALQRATVDRHMNGENEHDWDSVHDTFVQDGRAYWDAVPMATRFSGIGGVKDFYSTMEGAFPDARVIVTHAYDVPGTSIREVTITGTHVGEFGGIPANGNPYCYEAIGVYVFADEPDAGLLLGERVYFDVDSVLRQLRGDADAAVGGIGLAEGVTAG